MIKKEIKTLLKIFPFCFYDLKKNWNIDEENFPLKASQSKSIFKKNFT